MKELRRHAGPVFALVALLAAASARAESWAFGGYGEIHANMTDASGGDQIDIHRVVLAVGHDFAPWVRLASELEFEHSFIEGGEGGELAFEQLYIDFLLGSSFGLRAGRVLVPVGMINRRHEPPMFNGVERPLFDNVIIPTTWWSDGAGVFGTVGSAVQVEGYVLGGLDGTGISPTSGIRGGRIKERASLNDLAYTGRVDAFPFVRSLIGLGSSVRLGFATYYSGLDNGNGGSDPGVDGDLLVLAVDGEIATPIVELRGAFADERIDGAEALGNGVAEGMRGWNAEIAFRIWPDVWRRGRFSRADLVVFGRYDDVNTQADMPEGVARNLAGDREEWTAGATFHISPRFVVKADRQWGVAGRTNIGLGWIF